MEGRLKHEYSAVRIHPPPRKTNELGFGAKFISTTSAKKALRKELQEFYDTCVPVVRRKYFPNGFNFDAHYGILKANIEKTTENIPGTIRLHMKKGAERPTLSYKTAEGDVFRKSGKHPKTGNFVHEHEVWAHHIMKPQGHDIDGGVVGIVSTLSDIEAHNMHRTKPISLNSAYEQSRFSKLYDSLKDANEQSRFSKLYDSLQS